MPVSHTPPAGAEAIVAAVSARMHLVRYALFAATATALNLLCQNSALLILSGYWFGIYVAILFGNAAGLFLKFVADKYWVFDDQESSIVANSRKFALYAAFGVFTTLIFWTVELAFHFAFQSQIMTNVGAVIGLTIGYVAKYNLDKLVTFRDSAQVAGVKAR
jgi:putative flippase GtrA